MRTKGVKTPLYEIGDTVRFRPAATLDHSAGFPQELGVTVTGTVVQIHSAHRWYRVRYELAGRAAFECFPFPAAE